MRWRSGLVYAAMALLLFAAWASGTVPTYNGFTPRSPGYVVTATNWNGEFQNFISYVNTYLTAPLNNLTAVKGNLLTTDGNNVTVLTNPAVSNDILVTDTTQPSGLKWAAGVSGVVALTHLGDLITFNGTTDVAQSIGSATDGSILITDVTQPNGIGWQNLLPIGSIICWDLNQGAVPARWHLCDGTTVNGHVLPNMQGCYVVCAGTTSPGATGGMGLLGQGFGGDTSTGSGVGASYTVSLAPTQSQQTRISSPSYPANYTGVATPFTVTPPYFAISYIEKVQ
jgi:hypothetical protein